MNRCLCVSTPSITWKSYTIIIHGSRSWRNGRIRMSRAEFCFPTCFSYLFLLRRPFNPLGSAVVINISKEEVEWGVGRNLCFNIPSSHFGVICRKRRIIFFPSFRQKKKKILTNSLSFPHVIDACCVIISFRKLSTGSRREARWKMVQAQNGGGLTNWKLGLMSRSVGG